MKILTYFKKKINPIGPFLSIWRDFEMFVCEGEVTSEDCTKQIKYEKREISSNAQKRSDWIDFFFQIGQNCHKNMLVPTVFTLGKNVIFSKSGIL